ncbi:putative F-box domain-containing protein [Medicago truncatula]|uniref:Putative F-box domain-containing protein n=1 Tax=Medicago truncatula TaxID=3880 RepID=A0A396H4J7_MEDTR|nr:putative F-box domain-containing protein [Medicago truncatula]
MSRSNPTKDRISSLPDPIICHILSFLPTKNSAATSILSKRWKPIWLSVSTLDFDDETFPNYDSFRLFVLTVFLTRDISLPLHSFHLKCTKASYLHSEDINRFVQAATKRIIENLNLRMIFHVSKFLICLV